MNFVAGQHSGADIALHFNPRFDGWDKVVFNSMQGGKWGSEERKRSMPFHKGKAFELVFMVLAEHYKVGAGGGAPLPFFHLFLPLLLPPLPFSLSLPPSLSQPPSYLTFFLSFFPA